MSRIFWVHNTIATEPTDVWINSPLAFLTGFILPIQQAMRKHQYEKFTLHNFTLSPHKAYMWLRYSQGARLENL